MALAKDDVQMTLGDSLNDEDQPQRTNQFKSEFTIKVNLVVLVLLWFKLNMFLQNFRQIDCVIGQAFKLSLKGTPGPVASFLSHSLLMAHTSQTLGLH